MATPTLLDLITEILVGCGELAQGETPSPEDGAWCLMRANEWLDSLQTERLAIYEIQEQKLALTAKQSFQVGPGGADFPAVARPIKIDARVITVLVNGVQVRMGETDLIGEGRWREISDLSATSNVPELCYPDYGWPFLTLNFFPAPLCAVATFAQLSTWLPLQQFVNLTDTFNMPFGYWQAFVDGVTIRILKSYGHPIGQDDAAMEQTSKGRIQALNAQLPNIGVFNGAPPPNSPPPPAPAQ